jgi:hypothetical protein
MRASVDPKLEAGRVRKGAYASFLGGLMGAFYLRGPCGGDLGIISTGPDPMEYKGQPWEHVSVSLKHRCPNWQEMCFVKDLFWEESELVVQFHPPRSDYVDHHPYCLHLWRPLDGHIRTPPSILVGPKQAIKQPA